MTTSFSEAEHRELVKGVGNALLIGVTSRGGDAADALCVLTEIAARVIAIGWTADHDEKAQQAFAEDLAAALVVMREDGVGEPE